MNVLELKTKSLRKAIKTVKDCADRNGVLPITSCVRILKPSGSDIVAVYCTDLEAFKTTKFETESLHTHFDVCVDVEILHSTINLLVGELEYVKLESNGEFLTVYGEKTVAFRGEAFTRTYKYQLAGEDPTTFPNIPKIQKKHFVEVEPRKCLGTSNSDFYLSLNGTATIGEYDNGIGVRVGSYDQDGAGLFRVAKKQSKLLQNNGVLWFSKQEGAPLLLESEGVKTYFSHTEVHYTHSNQVSRLLQRPMEVETQHSTSISVDVGDLLASTKRVALSGGAYGIEVSIDTGGRLRIEATKKRKEIERLENEEGEEEERLVTVVVGKFIEHVSLNEIKGELVSKKLNAAAFGKALKAFSGEVQILFGRYQLCIAQGEEKVFLTTF